MAVQRFLARIAGITEQVMGLVTSAGAADAGKIVATDVDGRINPTLMPVGIGANTVAAMAKSTLAAGKFVTFINEAGTLKCVPADNSTGPANGYVTEAVTADDMATVYPLDGINSHLTGLTIGADYWLGTAGDPTDTPLDESDIANKGKYSQYVGKAKSTTELITNDDGFVKL